MERLTFDGNFCDISQCRELPCPHGGICTQRKAWEKLKAYEDTGLTPRLVQETAEFAIWVYENGLEKIKEWIKADKDGRLVVLPCKVGDTVYTLRRTFDGADVVGETELWWTDIPLLGKTVFLTREEAEKALEVVNDE